LNSQTANAWYVNPIRQATFSNVLYYDTTNKEITYGTGAVGAVGGGAVLQETTAANANSPVTFTLATKTLRRLNTAQFNNLGITLSGGTAWTFTIPTAGTYFFRARALYAATRNVGGINPVTLTSKLFLHYQNFTPTPLLDWIRGNSDRSAFGEGTYNINNLFNYSSELSGIGTTNANAVLSLEHQINNAAGGTNPTVIGGTPTNMGADEIYATLEIQRIA
jgi:hypothetical protein